MIPRCKRLVESNNKLDFCDKKAVISLVCETGKTRYFCKYHAIRDFYSNRRFYVKDSMKYLSDRAGILVL
jgi:hypothetical protein